MGTQLMDEFIVDCDKVPFLQQYVRKIERMYDVRVTFDIVTKAENESKSKQWLSIRGEHKDRQNSKEYVLAICHPREKQEIISKTHLEDETVEDIEKNTLAFVRYINGNRYEITGTDLAVTLAMSSLEDLLRKQDVEEDSATMETDQEQVSPWNNRLDVSLSRALSQNSDSACSLEDYDKAPTAVKRVLLQCLNESYNVTEDIDDSELFGSKVTEEPKRYKLPVLFGSECMDTSNGITNVNNLAGTLRVTIDNTSSTHDDTVTDGASCVEDESPTRAKVGNLADKLIKTNIAEEDSAEKNLFKKLTKNQEYLKNFGLTVGYSEECVMTALQFTDEQIQVADFLEMLGKLSEKSQTEKSSSSNNASAAGSEATNDNVSNGKTNFPPPPNHMPDFVSPTKPDRRSLPRDYKTQLLKDFSEEDDNLSVNELKQRNEMRQQILKAAYEDTVEGQGEWKEAATKTPNSKSPPGNKKTSNKGANSNKKKKKGKNKNRNNTSPRPTGGGSECPIEIDSDDETCVMKVWGSPSVEIVCVDTPEKVNNDDVHILSYSPAKVQPIIRHNPHEDKQSSPKRTGTTQRDFPPEPQFPAQGFQPFQMRYGGGSYDRGNEGVSYDQGTGARPPMKQPVEPADLRYIVIDGSNIAMAHGNNKIFSCRGIQICVQEFLRRGHKNVFAIVPHWRKCFPQQSRPIRDKDLLTKLQEDGNLVFTPSRKINGRTVASYDDRFILELAEREDGVIVSNDQYRDLMQEKSSWKKLIEDRLLMYTFAGDNFMIPEDPFGQGGLTLNELLRKGPKQHHMRKRPLSPEKWDRPPSHERPHSQGRPQSHSPPLHDYPMGLYQQHQQQHTGDGLLPLPNHHFPHMYHPQNPIGGGILQPPPIVPPMNYQAAAQRKPDNNLGNRAGNRGRGNPNSQQRQRHGSNPSNQQFSALNDRTKEQTDDLFKQLVDIFSEAAQEKKIYEILQNHAAETDINRLTNYCMSALFTD